MKAPSAIVVALSATASAHGVLVRMVGANGVVMPGLTIADGTPRDCSSNGCGSQADTAIIRDREIASGEVGPLGRTQGNGPVDAAVMIRNFMGTGSAPTNNGTGVGQEDNIPGAARPRDVARDEDEEPSAAAVVARQFAGIFGQGGTKANGPPESMVKATAGEGSSSGMPTVGSDGVVKMVYRQINQDGAGPMQVEIDGTSGGTQASAFQKAQVVKDVPGLGVQGISIATSTEFPLEAKMPAGMTCEATVADVKNVCIVRVRNGAAAGPFGGSGAFVQDPAARKRAIAYRLRKRMEFSNRS